MEMTDFLKGGTPSLDEMDPMCIMVDGLAVGAAKWAEKEGQVESRFARAMLSGSDSKERPRSPVDARNDTKSQRRSAKRVAVETVPSTVCSESKTRDPISQAASYAIEMMSVVHVHTWYILIIGTCISVGLGYLH
jgi:hypothetical protein